MNVLITGANGQLGTVLGSLLPDAILAGHSDLDITDEKAVKDFVKKNKIETVVNCAGYTAVDMAEDKPVIAKKVNINGPKNLAISGCRLIHISTDYVFDGKSKVPYKTTDTTNPLSVYGVTKLVGEKMVAKYARQYIIIRTSWLYSPYGKNFVKTMRNLGAERDVLNVVYDQYGTPTYALDLANAIVQIIPQMNSKNNGIYHFSNMGQCSWAVFADEIMKKSGLKCKINPITTAQYPTRAVRPQYSVLDKSKIQKEFGIKIDDWQSALCRCINEMQK